MFSFLIILGGIIFIAIIMIFVLVSYFLFKKKIIEDLGPGIEEYLNSCCEKCNLDYEHSVFESSLESRVNIPVKRVCDTTYFSFPERATEGSAGFDIRAQSYSTQDELNKPNALLSNEDTMEDYIQLKPGAVAVFGTNLSMQIPDGYYFDICTRSGLGVREGLIVANTPARVDSDYRGEIKVGIRNISNETRQIKLRSRIAQMTLHKITEPIFREVETLDKTERGEGGFGHTGVE